MIPIRIHHFTLLNSPLNIFSCWTVGTLCYKLKQTFFYKLKNILLCFKPKHQCFIEGYSFARKKHIELGGNVQINHMQRAHVRCVSSMR